jgi:glycosyltransferase involved in cell wall biosynthesis
VSERVLVSICIPVLNEQENIKRLHSRLITLAENLNSKYEFEFIYTDNQSSDNTWELIQDLSTIDKRVVGYRFTKNIGFQKSILMNFSFTRGAVVVEIDADLQDPPEMIEDFLSKWEEGYRVVYGVRRKRQEGAITGLVRRFGYWAVDLLSEHSIPRGAGDFRLLDRRVVAALLAQNNPRPYIRGTIASMGFKSVGLDYDRAARTEGESKIPFGKVIKLGLAGILDNSVAPLRLAVVLGLFFMALAIGVITWTVLSRTLDPSWPQGYASLFSAIFFGFGVNALLIGIVGEYILRIYLTLRAEPMGFVADSTVPE